MNPSDEGISKIRGANLPIFVLDDAGFWPEGAIAAAVADIERDENERFLNIKLPQILRQSRLRANKRKKRARARTGRR